MINHLVVLKIEEERREALAFEKYKEKLKSGMEASWLFSLREMSKHFNQYLHYKGQEVPYAKKFVDKKRLCHTTLMD